MPYVETKATSSRSPPSSLLISCNQKPDIYDVMDEDLKGISKSVDNSNYLLCQIENRLNNTIKKCQKPNEENNK